MLFAQRKYQLPAEDLVKFLDSVTVVIGKGKQATLDIEDEISIPDDLNLLGKEAARAPARLAFWKYQEARAKRSVRAARDLCESAKAKANLIYRKAVDNGTLCARDEEFEWKSTDFGLLPSLVENDDDVRAAKIKLIDREYELEVIEAVASAVSHRVYVLNRLLESSSGHD